MAIVYIKNLRLRTIIGIFDWEREHQQEIILNIKIKFDDSLAAKSDDINDTIDYKKMKHKIMEKAENSSFYLIEKLSEFILDIIMEDPKVIAARLKLDKPHALRFADSVSIEKVRIRN
jgi:D-erythro-7,8-dihydroneopterin triphosphate epimerase